MKRGIKDFFSRNAINHICFIPVIILTLKNWLPFILNYLGIRNKKTTYILRNNTTIETNSNIDTATIAVVFIKKDYGKIPNNATIIDIGANIGCFSLYAANGSKNTHIYAYEPLQETYKLLQKNIKNNKLDSHVKIFNYGITGKKETRKLFLAEDSPFHSIYQKESNHSIEINCIGLKDVFDEQNITQCDLLKIDCEGAEFEILYNTPKEYLDKIKEIRLEYHNQETEKHTLAHLKDFLESNGFKQTKLKEDFEYSGNAWFEKV